MKRMVLMALFALALPLAAFAGSVDFTNSTGVLSGSSAGLSLSSSELIAVNGLNGLGLVTGGLGNVSFSTGTLMAGGSLQMGGTFASGGSFTITGNGTDGIPNATIFKGTFTSPVTWTLMPAEGNGSHNYMLSGVISGTWWNGATVFGATTQLTINTGKGFFGGSTNISSGDTNITTVPEPGTLALLGTGLLGLAGALRRKLKV
jgi:PEP-CTERM motif-containing protein